MKGCLVMVSVLVSSSLGGVDVGRSQSIPLPDQAASMPKNVQQVATFLEGVMTTSAQTAANPKAANVQMTTCRVKLSNGDEPSLRNSVFLYQEQALINQLDQPYRQRFLQIKPSENGQVESRSFKLAKPTELIGLCNRSSTSASTMSRIVQPDTLGTPVCSVLLKPKGDRFIGETPPQGCPTTVRGAVRITNTIELFADGMETWDRGFDADGKQLWGAKNESYQYRRSR
jgi:CpeT/CpcT family (DUF1001)